MNRIQTYADWKNAERKYVLKKEMQKYEEWNWRNNLIEFLCICVIVWGVYALSR